MMSALPLEYQPGKTPVTFLDHRTLKWGEVRRAFYGIEQRLHYEYPTPVRELRHRLMVVPADQHGWQKLESYEVQCWPQAATRRERVDDFGNRVVEFEFPRIERSLTFAVRSQLVQEVQAGARPTVAVDEAQRYLPATRLTTADATLTAVAAALRQQEEEPWALADAINRWTHHALRYERGLTRITTTAAEALALGGGLCQDYAHVMLAICRSAGLPARYVSGHLLGEGASHAWVEVLLPTPQTGELTAWAFDPTNHCQAGHKYITVAVGRDYTDVSPTSGSFLAAAPGRLVISKQAGVTAVEDLAGRVVRAAV